ncbi:type I-E CRISPR-associated endonuclease Cas1e [Rathayibacter toxicus]|uniref:CRISPR-associated endonuclease Cas1 n=2 Tax=Rathayibacter toxicus TaxID=145458 RepID=A0A0C5BCW4_9MICO|nr:type I-E CRISPR-associated endonuclease Cas1e [Rathayibacter toxicus]AJM76844.1 CRISPR-associated protein Cse1 [Rathayibacter toxicus]ALS57395.1 type I-E CRISPR-associated endonuclease Cas1 [Rathayibacter toxicus]KKM45643.1 CRISPR-associated protein Cse1 [Rathayibacter toxicus]PPG24727.1 type I-E CRISPR-associated endonuclease Cas1 [Rathayibacter toxicus]PPG48181.1 type I-E CRISPR-associated endonuclease Cas1 [Rathayibacter toxicus]
MTQRPGTPKPDLPELLRAEDRLSFVYIERSIIHRDQNAIIATDERGTVHIPAATLGALLLGPGTRVSHQAMMLLADSGSTAVWVGEHGVRYYAHGRSLARSSRLIEAQARLVSNQSSRLRVARAMYSMRFVGEVVDRLTMEQLRGREGQRVRRTYRENAERTGITWKSRSYKPDDPDSGDAVNQALTAANQCLYGVVHAVIVALGCSPSLGFVHTGHARSFVFDVADLYKAELTIPTAFDIVAAGPVDIEAETRHAFRDSVSDGHLLARCARDIKKLLLPEELSDPESDLPWGTAGVVSLWDGAERTVASGRSYGEIDDEEPPEDLL